MFTNSKPNPVTNADRFESAYYDLVNEIDMEIADLVRKMVTKAHTENSDGLKFNLGNDLDIALENHLLRTGFTKNVEKVLDEIDDQKSYY